MGMQEKSIYGFTNRGNKSIPLRNNHYYFTEDCSVGQKKCQATSLKKITDKHLIHAKPNL